MMRAICVDDEPKALEIIQRHCEKIPFLQLTGSFRNALDALDSMLPAAQRMAELLDAQLLDEEQNALGRQRILSLRDEMRQYDRQHRDWPASTR